MTRHKHYPEGLEVVGYFSVDRHLKLQKFRLREKRCYPLVYFFCLMILLNGSALWRQDFGGYLPALVDSF